MSLTEECEKVTGIPYVMRACRKEAGSLFHLALFMLTVNRERD